MKLKLFFLVALCGIFLNAFGQIKVNSSGDVGVGITTTPKGKLHWNGCLYGQGDVRLHAYPTDGTNGTAYLQARDNSGSSSIGLTLRTQNSGSTVDAIRINYNGNVGIGVSPTSSYKLRVMGDFYIGYSAKIYSGTDKITFMDGVSDTDIYLIEEDEEPSFQPMSDNYGYLGTYSKQFWRVYSNKVYGNRYVLYSDIRLKENIRPLQNPIEKIKNIRSIKYDLIYTPDPSMKQKKKEQIEKDNKDRIGFVAQELLEIYPELVDYDEENDIYAVDYIGMIPVLVEAIKEQQTIIDCL